MSKSKKNKEPEIISREMLDRWREWLPPMEWGTSALDALKSALVHLAKQDKEIESLDETIRALRNQDQDQ